MVLKGLNWLNIALQTVYVYGYIYLSFRDGPRPRQTVILVFIGVVSAMLGLGKMFTNTAGHGKTEFQREYVVQLSEHSSKLTR